MSAPTPSPTPLSSATPQAVGAAAAGVATAAARADHVHAHGAQAGGSLHAAAVASGAAGFLTGADQAKLDSVAAGAAALSSATPQPVGAAAAGAGALASRADHVHAHGDQTAPTLHAAATQSANGFQSSADKIKQDVSVADWSLAQVRYFLLDFDGGLDTHTGYVDAAAGATLVPAGLAIKTWQRLFQILPTQGAGRKFKILVKNRAAGATYLEQDLATAADVDLGRLSGYAAGFVWGATDLTNDAADRRNAGFIVGIAGPGGSSEWTVTTGGTATVFSVASGTFTIAAAEGMRIRFLTGALAGQCAFISANTATQLTVGSGDLTVPPVNGDTFLVEVPGVRINTLRHYATFPTTIVGIAPVSAVTRALDLGGPGPLSLAGLETTSTTTSAGQFTVQNAQLCVMGRTVLDETAATVSIGLGGRARGNYLFSDIPRLVQTEFAHVGVGAALLVRYLRIMTGTIMGGASVSQDTIRIGVESCGLPFSNPGSAPLVIGSGAGATTPTRMTSTFRCVTVNAAFAGVAFSSASAAGSAISYVGGAGSFTSMSVDSCTGTVTAGSFGIDISSVEGNCVAMLGINGVNTVTGSGGDVRLPTGPFAAVVAASHTDLATVGEMLLPGGLTLVGLAVYGPPMPVTGMTNSSGGAVAQGELVRSNGTTGQVTNAVASSEAGATAVIGPMALGVASAARGLVVTAGARLVKFTAAPTVGLLAYLSTITTGQATTFTSSTGPVAGANLYKLRLGYVIAASGTLGIVAWEPDKIPTLADGLL